MTRYATKGTCAREIELDIDDNGCISHVEFFGGCNGNLKAISKLITGQPAREVADTLRGNTCGPRDTSCADQLSRAIEMHLK